MFAFCVFAGGKRSIKGVCIRLSTIDLCYRVLFLHIAIQKRSSTTDGSSATIMVCLGTKHI